MLARPDLSDDAITGIIDYLRSVPGGDEKSIKLDPAKTYAGDTSAGHTKFATYCAACHGPEGTGYAAGGSGPAIGLGGFLSLASDDYIFQTVKHGRVGTAMRPFIGPTGIANLSTSDVSDIISYLRTLN
jgi:cytochrome c oxidase cbb3-type subunit 3